MACVYKYNMYMFIYIYNIHKNNTCRSTGHMYVQYPFEFVRDFVPPTYSLESHIGLQTLCDTFLH